MNECGICKKCTDQHLLAKCDTCHLYYHLGCLNPPLSRHPKRSKLYAWQCSECDKSDDSAPENVIIPKGPRRSRIRYSKDGPIIPDPLRDSFGSEKSMSMSRKSDESHHRGAQLNGTNVDPDPVPDVAVSETPETLKIATEPTLSETEAIITSTPKSTSIECKEKEDTASSSQKKRGRKPKSKSTPNVPSFDSSSHPTDLSVTTTTLPSKENPIDNEACDLNSFKQQPLIIGQLEAITSTNLSDLHKSEALKSMKKGRPKKEKPSITQISNQLQKKQEINQQQEVKAEVTLIDLSRKVGLPLEQYRAFSDIPNSIPYPAPVAELPKVVTEAATDDQQVIPPIKPEPISTNFIVNGGTTSTNSGHKHKKQKKNKRHRSHSPSSGERQSSSKKHKSKKHKHKTHDLERRRLTQSIQNAYQNSQESK